STAPVRAASIAPNAQRLLWAGFIAMLATGIGFAIRGAILATWAADFGFTGAQLGAIGGAGVTGFFFGILIRGVGGRKNRPREARVARPHFGCRAQGTVAIDRPPGALNRHVRVRAGQRDARSGRQPARLDTVSEQP